MLEELHHFELSEDSLGADQALENIGEFLEGNTFVVSRICDRPDNAKCTIPNGSIRLIIGTARIQTLNKKVEPMRLKKDGSRSLTRLKNIW